MKLISWIKKMMKKFSPTKIKQYKTIPQMWQLEHLKRQETLDIAIDNNYTSQESAEILDFWDNKKQESWVQRKPILIISQN